MAGGAGGRTLEQTPTWAVATVCALFVIISVLIEHGIHSLGKLFQKRQKKAMAEALEKIKAELMLLGFISLLLTMGTKYIPDICIAKDVGKTMLPCKYDDGDKYGDDKEKGGTGDHHDRRRLLSYAGDMIWRRALAASDGASACGTDKVELISTNGMHDLHIFIFVLAVFHILYSVVTIVLAKAKMNKWKAWELETTTIEYQYTTDPSRFRLTHQTSFVKRHSGVSRTPGLRWIVAFFRQFFSSVTKVDYLTMRRGFINAHFAPDSKFDFHKYIKRSMEDDFKVVVGISIPLWIIAIIFLLVNVEKWHTLTWLSFLPLVILLLVGTKLELIMMEMAQEIQDRSTVVRGAPVVEPNNKYFWFNRPHWVLLLIHYTLFQNAYQMAYFLWVLMTLGVRSCLHEEMWITVTKVVVSIVLQFLCSYITFPLYALVTQMGSHMKKAIFEEQTANALRKWQKAAKQRKKQKKLGQPDASPTPSYMSGETTSSQAASPIHLLHNHKFRSSHGDVESVPNSPGYLSDTELSEMEFESRIQHEAHVKLDDDAHNIDFSFAK